MAGVSVVGAISAPPPTHARTHARTYPGVGNLVAQGPQRLAGGRPVVGSEEWAVGWGVFLLTYERERAAAADGQGYRSLADEAKANEGAPPPNSSIHSLTHSLIHPFTYPSIHPSIHSCMHFLKRLRRLAG